MNELRTDLRKEFHDPDVRHIYADESLNTHIATQLKVLREQRGWTQNQLAKAAEMAQPRIAVMEDVNYSSWSLKTLKRLAKAFDVRLSVRFESFSSLIPELEEFSRESLQKPSFADDSWFHKKEIERERVDDTLRKQLVSAPAGNVLIFSNDFNRQMLANSIAEQPKTGDLYAALSSAAG